MNSKLKFMAFGIIICLLAYNIHLGNSSSHAEKNSARKVILTDQAPNPIGPYSQAILINNTLYLSGQIAIDPGTGNMVDGGIEAETKQVMKNLDAVLKAAGFSFNDVVKTQVFLKDLNDYATFNAIYAEYFTVEPPSRAVVEAARIPKDALIEIMMTAEK